MLVGRIKVTDIIAGHEVVKISNDVNLGEVKGFGNATIDFAELGEEGEKRYVRFGGTCMKENETSRNKVKYRSQNITENDGRDSKFFVTHKLTPMNSVGHVKFIKEGEVLKYEARARNTKTHPDIVDQIKDRHVDVSIDYRFKNVIATENDKKEREYLVEGTEMRGLCAVGVGGIASSSIEYAIAEKWQDYDKLKKLTEKEEIKKENEKVENKKDEVFQMEATQELLDKIKQEKESVEKANIAMEAEKVKLAEEKTKMESELNQFKKEKEERIKAEKDATVKKLIEVNKELKESELQSKDQSELNMMLSYEQKLTEKEGAGNAPGNGNSHVSGEGQEGDEEKSFHSVENIMIEKETQDIKLNKTGLKKFNDDLLHSIYR